MARRAATAAVRSGERTPRQRAGALAEQSAAEFLLRAGCRVLARNVCYPEGELDLIVGDGDTVAFVEVRLRSSINFGGAAASVDGRKQRRLTRAAQHWLLQNHQAWPVCRFDVVTVDGNGKIEWIRDAFSAQETR